MFDLVFDKLGEGIYGLKKFFKNKNPLTKWGYTCNVYKVYDKNKLKALGGDSLRKSTTLGGDVCYILRSNGKELLPPPAGYEDKADALTVLELENDYKYIFPELDDDGKNLVFHLRDDETIKYLYAQKQIDTALRFSPELAWYQNGIFYLIVIFGITVVWYLITATAISSNLQGAVSSFISVVQDNTNALLGLSNQLGGLANKPPI